MLDGLHLRPHLNRYGSTIPRERERAEFDVIRPPAPATCRLRAARVLAVGARQSNVLPRIQCPHRGDRVQFRQHVVGDDSHHGPGVGDWLVTDLRTNEVDEGTGGRWRSGLKNS